MTISMIQAIDMHMLGHSNKNSSWATMLADSNKNSNWATMLADSIKNKNFAMLCNLLCHGKGFNDKSKEIFCDLVGSKRVFTAKAIKATIANHCGLAIASIDLHFDYHYAIKNRKHTKDKLLEAFDNGNEWIDTIDGQIPKGFNRIVKNNRKTYLLNSDNRGFQLPRIPIKDYAISSCELSLLTKQYEDNVELNSQPTQLEQSALN